jgi:hypothetical protein
MVGTGREVSSGKVCKILRSICSALGEVAINGPEGKILSIDKGVYPNKVRKLAFMLNIGKCSWIHGGGGCTMCNLSMRGKNQFGAQGISDLFERKLAMYSALQEDLAIDIYVGGSFFDKEQLPLREAKAILAILERDNRVRQILVETRPEHINRSEFEEVVATVKRSRLEIAIGLESVNDWTRDFCVNKGFSFEEFCDAIAIIPAQNLVIYLLLKPAFLDEREALLDCFTSINLVVSAICPRRIVVMPCNVQSGTLLYYLQQQGLYRPPFLWTAVSLLKACQGAPVSIGGFSFSPKPLDSMRNCGLCDASIEKLIRRPEIDTLTASPCDCYKSWEDNISSVPDRERFMSGFLYKLCSLAKEFNIDRESLREATDEVSKREPPEVFFKTTPKSLYDFFGGSES